ncbi:MAG TPA: hypothetical protein VK105_08665 [Virgibacillus sp.]|nr:hypothetical protein [Virgibacillus sp.]HLR67191.1 hypothetical protein [Virgibacillus sp.]
MKWLVYLYPKAWRKRYGNELTDLLEQIEPSIKVVMDLLLGILDAWYMELNEKYFYGYRISQILIAIAIVNVFIVLKLKPLGEVFIVELFATIAVLIAMLSLLMSISIFGLSIYKFGREGLTLKPKLTKISLGFMGAYGVFIATFLVLIN